MVASLLSVQAYILTVEVQYTEISVTSFLTYLILVQMVWKNSNDFYVFVIPFYYSFCENII